MAVLYYLVLKPLSWLPFRALYVLSDVLYIMLYKIAGYRKKVVLTNLRKAFPEKTQKELHQVASGYYRHFCDLIVESIKIFSISREEAVHRCRLKAPERWQKLYETRHDLVLVGGHYNNWELMAVSIASQVPHKIYGLYRPLKSKFMNRKINESRGKYGMIMHPAKQVKDIYETPHDTPLGAIFGADQSPTTAKKVYWMPFLNQETAVFFGVENCARKYDCPVVYGYIHKVRRGYYEVTYEVLEENAAESPYGKITQQHTLRLQKQILEDPTKWTWSHKRWKRKREEGEALNAVMEGVTLACQTGNNNL